MHWVPTTCKQCPSLVIIEEKIEHKQWSVYCEANAGQFGTCSLTQSPSRPWVGVGGFNHVSRWPFARLRYFSYNQLRLLSLLTPVYSPTYFHLGCVRMATDILGRNFGIMHLWFCTCISAYAKENGGKISVTYTYWYVSKLGLFWETICLSKSFDSTLEGKEITGLPRTICW